MANVFHSPSLQDGEWSERCVPAVLPLWRGGGWKGLWVRFLMEEDERVGQADSNPPGVAAAGSQWRGGQRRSAQTATRGEGSPSWTQMLIRFCCTDHMHSASVFLTSCLGSGELRCRDYVILLCIRLQKSLNAENLTSCFHFTSEKMMDSYSLERHWFVFWDKTTYLITH